jgi:hypothetical protein
MSEVDTRARERALEASEVAEARRSMSAPSRVRHEVSGRCSGVTVPILATRKDGQQFAIGLSGPLTADHPADASLLQLEQVAGAPKLIIVNELLVRGNLPAATREIHLGTSL